MAKITPSNLPSDAVLDAVALKAFQFIRAVSSNSGIRAAFSQRGYSEEIHQNAWMSVLKAAGFYKDPQSGTQRPEAAAALAVIDAWDEPTFNLAHAILAPMPEQQAFVFDGLEAQSGAASVGSVTTLLDRLDELETSKERKATRKEDLAAIAKLAERRIDANERKRLRDLLAVATGFSDPTVVDSPKAAKQKEEQRQAKIAVWYYYNEWSAIARLDIKRRDYLIQLGLVKRSKKKPKGGGGATGGVTGGAEVVGG